MHQLHLLMMMKAKHGTFINFTKVYAFKELKNIIDKRNAKNILLAIPSLSANGKEIY